MRKSLLTALLMLVLGMTGCASKLMQPADVTASTAQPSPDEATIVFFRSTNFGGAIQAFVCEVVNDELKFIAVVSAGMKVAIKTTPGKHVYMTGAESAELMDADLEGGKTYYTYVSPRFGMWKANFVFVPVTDKDLVTDGFKKDLAWCAWHKNKPEAQAWFLENLSSLKAKYAEALADYKKAKSGDKKVILPEYGSAVPVQ